MTPRDLVDGLVLLLLVWWLDRRFNRIERLAEPLEAPDPAPAPTLCAHRRGSTVCVRPLGHPGDHSARTGVTWAGQP